MNDLIERAESWPEEARTLLLHAAETIERSFADVYVLSTDERKAIEEGLDDIRHGRIAGDAEIEAIFAQCR
ncbi:MAG: hypothetical protein HC855_03100 [Rhizobiales bacterium]|nr:hypothetical protein [Hyphomicrobiales bacterium]